MTVPICAHAACAALPAYWCERCHTGYCPGHAGRVPGSSGGVEVVCHGCAAAEAEEDRRRRSAERMTAAQVFGMVAGGLASVLLTLGLMLVPRRIRGREVEALLDRHDALMLAAVAVVVAVVATAVLLIERPPRRRRRGA